MTVALDDPAIGAPARTMRVSGGVAEEWYVETSALVKLFVGEVRSRELIAWLDALEERGGVMFVSELVRTETYRAVVRARPALSGTVGPLLDDLAAVRMSERDLVHARVLQPMTVRTLDALHLAIALGHEGRTAGIVTYDRRIVDAAGGLGIRTVSP
jgi:predicted nucleic acid-binding protein